MESKNKMVGSFLVLVQVGVVSAADYYVAENGVDTNPGTEAAPFGTIQHAFDTVGAGDSIFLRGGTYREAVVLNGVSGASGAPITLTAYPGEVPVISGLDVLSNLSWTVSGIPEVYVSPYGGEQFDQLFFNGKPMLEARWPNVPTDAAGDWDFFSPDVWAAVDSSGSSYGTIQDADLGTNIWSAAGSRIVLNVDHQFYCWSRTVTSHSAGSDTLHYPTDLASVSSDPVDHFYDDRYYLVGELNYLDEPGEWVYDETNHLLYFYPPNGMDPNSTPVEIKQRDFGIIADQNSNYITVDGITFWGTAFQFGENADKKSSHIVFRNNTVLHSSWTEYFKMPDGDPNKDRDRVCPTIQADRCLIEDNTFAYGALSALFINGFDNIIENNVFHDFNYSSSLVSPSLEVGRNCESYAGTGGRAVVCCNSLYNGGGVLVATGLEDNDIYLNDLSDMFRSCWGGNKDHSALYSSGHGYNRGTRFHHNWIHDGYAGTPPLPWGGGMGIRGDDDTLGLTVDHNVMWNLGSAGITIKNPDNASSSNANTVANNTVFNHSVNNSTESAVIVMTDSGQNRYSTVDNNMAETVYGGWFQKPLGAVGEFLGNSTGTATEDLLAGTNWFDFRPAAGATGIVDGGVAVPGITDGYVGSAPDVGAYEAGDSVYWIPGRRTAKASFPIVPDGAVVPLDRDVLMWRPARNASAHRLYFGFSPESLLYQAEFTGETNVFILPPLSAGLTYYWRVDALMPDASVVEGDVWSFSVGGFTTYPILQQHWGFDQPDGTQLTAVTNSVAGGADWLQDKANITVSGQALRATQSLGGTFVNSASVGGITNGLYELSWIFSGIDLSAPDGTYVTYGAGLYNSSFGSFFDLAFTRVLWNSNGQLTLQSKNGTTGAWDTIHDFGITSLATNAAIRMVCDLDTDLYDVYLNDNGAGETRIGTDIPMKDGRMDVVRMGGSTQNMAANNFIDIDDLRLSYILLVDSPARRYEVWVNTFALGSQTNLLDDPDGDLLDNLAEYAWGGEPDNPASQGNLPWSETASSGGTNYLQYIYYERTDALSRGLDTLLEVGTDLVNTNWGVHAVETVGWGLSDIPGYLAVTNRIPTDAEPRQFIRHRIRFTP